MEDLNGNIMIVVEYITAMAPKVDTLVEDMKIVKSDIILLKAGHAHLAEKTDIIQRDVKEIKDDLKQKADTKDLKALDHRVTRLETKMA